jgi:3-oxoadipate enol-lactonase
VSGEGPPLVFVHANPFDHRLWLYQVAHFSPYFRCVSVDIRGYGRSDKVETPFSLADMKDDVLAVCRAEGITAAMFCGCSVGSPLCIRVRSGRPTNSVTDWLLDQIRMKCGLNCLLLP